MTGQDDVRAAVARILTAAALELGWALWCSCGRARVSADGTCPRCSAEDELARLAARRCA